MAEITWSVVGDEQGGLGEVDEHGGSVSPYAQAYDMYNMAFSGEAFVGPLLGGLIRYPAIDSRLWMRAGVGERLDSFDALFFGLGSPSGVGAKRTEHVLCLQGYLDHSLSSS